MKRLTLDRAALDAMFVHARETHPDECCGAVIHRDGRDVVRRFTNVQNELHAEDPVANPRTAATAYAPKHSELFAAQREGEQPGASLLVFYHSHAINGSYFSDEDKKKATEPWDEPNYPDVTYVVVSDARERGEARAFRWDEAARDFVEVPIEVRDT
jgi:proteasome lid subunit RPN8/RPN11